MRDHIPLMDGMWFFVGAGLMLVLCKTPAACGCFALDLFEMQILFDVVQHMMPLLSHKPPFPNIPRAKKLGILSGE